MRNWPITVLVVAAAVVGCHKKAPPPSLDGLKAALQRSAEQALPAPVLSNEQVILPAKAGQSDAQAAEIVGAATAAGGAAVRSINGQGHVSMLASIPENNAEAFKAALRHEKATMATPSGTTRLIEVVIESTSASPTP